MQGINLRLHESCLENRSIRSLDALMADEELDINARDKVGIWRLRLGHDLRSSLCILFYSPEWKDTPDSSMSLSSF